MTPSLQHNRFVGNESAKQSPIRSSIDAPLCGDRIYCPICTFIILRDVTRNVTLANTKCPLNVTLTRSAFARPFAVAVRRGRSLRHPGRSLRHRHAWKGRFDVNVMVQSSEGSRAPGPRPGLKGRRGRAATAMFCSAVASTSSVPSPVYTRHWPCLSCPRRPVALLPQGADNSNPTSLSH